MHTATATTRRYNPTARLRRDGLVPTLARLLREAQGYQNPPDCTCDDPDAAGCWSCEAQAAVAVIPAVDDLRALATQVETMAAHQDTATLRAVCLRVRDLLVVLGGGK